MMPLQAQVKDVSELSWLTGTAGVGNEVKLKVFRDGGTQETAVRVSEKPSMMR